MKHENDWKQYTGQLTNDFYIIKIANIEKSTGFCAHGDNMIIIFKLFKKAMFALFMQQCENCFKM